MDSINRESIHLDQDNTIDCNPLLDNTDQSYLIGGAKEPVTQNT